MVETAKIGTITGVINAREGRVDEISLPQLIEIDGMIDECCHGNCDNCSLGSVTFQGDLCLQITHLVIQKNRALKLKR